jgi:hypothetical protein
MGQAVRFWEVWQLWAAGKPTQHLVLWGQTILWWGRTGKVCQFVAGLVVVLDILGSERAGRATSTAVARGAPAGTRWQAWAPPMTISGEPLIARWRLPTGAVDGSSWHRGAAVATSGREQ